MLLILFLINFSFASEVGNKQTLRDLKPSQRKLNWRALPTIEPVLKKKKAKSYGNLGSKMYRRSGSNGRNVKDPLVFPKLEGVNQTDLVRGDILTTMIKQDLIGYVGSLSPVRAEVLDGPYKGYMFVGNATMDPKTKDIVIQFDTFRSQEGRSLHKLKASIHNSTGALGIKGTHHSKYWQYFFASVLTRGAQGYSDALVERDRNLFGQYQVQPGPENAGKVAVAEGASATADILADNMKNAPEYTTVKGPILTKVFIIETPEAITRR